MFRRSLSVALATALALCVGSAAAKPKASSSVQLPDLKLDTYKLSNGLGVTLYEDHSTPIVGVDIWYHVGSGNEHVGRTGFAHLFEHMMFQGSGHQDDEYINEIQGMGGGVNGSTTEDRTNYWELIPASHLEQALLLEADRMGWLLDAMTQKKLDNQRDVVRNERRQNEGQPYSAFNLNFNQAFYPKGHPYDHSVIGEHEDLVKASLDDVKDFFRTFYTPNNATLVISGDFDPAVTKQWVEKYFGPIPPGPPVMKMKEWIPEMTTERRVTFQDRVQLPRIYWCWATPPAYADGDADLNLAAQVLGGSITSRLDKRLVHEEKLAQAVNFFISGQQVCSEALLSVTLRPDADQAKVERIVDEELARFASSGPSSQELDQAKNETEAGFVEAIQSVGGFRGINDRLNRYNHYVGRPNYLREDWERYATRTPSTVKEAFRRWIGAGRMVATVLPFEGGKPTVADVDRTKLPAPSPEPKFKAPEVQRRTLPNGLQVVFLPHHELPLVQMDLVFIGGAASDPADRGGLCDITGSMHLEGTKRHDKFAFQSALEAIGTNLDVNTSEDRTVFSMQCLANHVDDSVGLFAEAIREPAFPTAEFTDLQQRSVTDIRRQGDQPFAIVARATRRVVYGEDHPYGRDPQGTVESLKSIGLDDIRRYSAEHFLPGGATLVVVGDTNLDDIQRAVETSFKGWSGKAPAGVDVPDPKAIHGRTVYLVDKPGDSQSTVSIVEPSVRRNDPAWEKLSVANRMFGGAFSARLNLNLREDKGYTYGVRSTLNERMGRGTITIGGRVQTEVTAPSLTEFEKEIADAAGHRPFTQKELDFAKESILLGYPSQFETVEQLANALESEIVCGLPDDEFAHFPDKVSGVDLAESNAAGKQLLHPNDEAIIVVGDLSKIEKSVKDLGLGTIVHLNREGRRIDETKLSSR